MVRFSATGPDQGRVFPLKKNEPRLVELARGLKRELQASGIRTVYDDTGAIGKHELERSVAAKLR